jgi:hypothetical protein
VLANHPEIALARRNIMRYIVAAPSKRAEGIHALLKLDRLVEMRGVLNGAKNKLKAAEKSAAATCKQDADALTSLLGLEAVEDEEVLLVVNERRRALGIKPLESLTVSVDLSAGMDAPSKVGPDKLTATKDFERLRSILQDRSALTKSAFVLYGILAAIDQEAGYLALIGQRDLVERGMTTLVDRVCPLCDHEWPDVESLRLHLIEKKARSDSAAELRNRFKSASEELAELFGSIRRALGEIERLARGLGQDAAEEAAREWAARIVRREEQLRSEAGAAELLARLVSPREPDETTGLPGTDSAPELDDEAVGQAKDWPTHWAKLEGAIAELPEPSSANEAVSFISVAQERWKRYGASLRSLGLRERASSQADAAAKAFESAMTDVLTELYAKVEADFSAYYRRINADDEASFSAELRPTDGKLDLVVDFYGVALFQPNAYHSEGHQDSMGLCLYLALMKQLMGQDFRLALLDDVVMSVDKGHRRELCDMLKESFPEVQFVITTHDEVWANQLVTTGVIPRSGHVRLSGWTLDGGPDLGDMSESWAKIAALLEADDVATAAACLRRLLEHALAELAESLRAKVVYKSGGSHDLGDFLEAIGKTHKQYLLRAGRSAESWGSQTDVEKVARLEAARVAAMQGKDADQWMVNPAVHYTEWATFSKEDFGPVVRMWRRFLDLFTCENAECGSWIYVSGPPRKEDQLRCRCLFYNLNLAVKPA